MRVSAVGRAIAAAIDFACDHRRTNGLLGAPVGGVDRGRAQEPEEGAPLAIEMRDKPLHVRHDRRPVEHASELLFEMPARDGDTVLRNRACGVAIAHRQRPLQEILHVAGNAGVRMRLLQFSGPADRAVCRCRHTAHLIRRCRDLAAVATPAAARFPLRVKALLEEGLALRDRYANQEISLHGLWTATGRLEVKLDRVLARTYHDAANRRLAKHLDHERPYLFTFLYCPGLDATNNAAERAIRALVGARKNWGGNRTPNGARAQAVLTSLLQTAKQQGKNPFDVVVELLCSRERHKILDLVPLNRETLHDSSPASPPPVALINRCPSSSLSDLAVPA